MTMPGGSPPEGSLVEGSHFSQDIPNSQSGVMGLIKGQTTGPWSDAQDSFRSNIQSPLAAQIAIANSHEVKITQLEASYRQMILQGEALVFTTPGIYYPSEGIVSSASVVVDFGFVCDCSWCAVDCGVGGGGEGDGVAAGECVHRAVCAVACG